MFSEKFKVNTATASPLGLDIPMIEGVEVAIRKGIALASIETLNLKLGD